MPTEKAFKFEIENDLDTFWHDHLEVLLPYRYVRDGYANSWFLFLYASVAQTLEQKIRDAQLIRQLKYNENADSQILNSLAESVGIFNYTNESSNNFRTRILNRWENTKNFGIESQIITELSSAGYVSSSIEFDLGGTDVEIPAVKGGSDYNIPAYPPSSEFKSQFSLQVNLNSIPTGTTGSLSNLITNEELTDIRQIVSKYKPVQWICREILLITGSGNWYSEDGLEYGGGEVYAADSITVERHRSKI